MSLNIKRPNMRFCRTALMVIPISIALSGCHPKTEARRPGAEAAERSKAFQTDALLRAIAAGDVKKAESAIAAGADVNVDKYSDFTGYEKNALNIAMFHKRTEMVRLLLENGADVNAKSELSGRTPLMSAAGIDGKTEIVRLLLENGADVNAADHYGHTALMIAMEGINDSGNQTETVVKLLLEKGADVNAKNKAGNTALHSAAENGFSDYATHDGRVEAVVKLLLEKGADVNAKANDGGTALMEAAGNGQTGTVKLLLGKGADVNAKANSGMTALMEAASYGPIEIIKLLLENGADVNAKNDSGKTALDYATIGGTYTGIADLLRAKTAK